MPGIDGLALAERVAKLPVPPAVIFVSGGYQGDAEAEARARGVAVRGFLPKPIDGRRLAALLAGVAGSRAATAEAGPEWDGAAFLERVDGPAEKVPPIRLLFLAHRVDASGVLLAERPGEAARIVLKAGRVVHVEGVPGLLASLDPRLPDPQNLPQNVAAAVAAGHAVDRVLDAAALGLGEWLARTARRRGGRVRFDVRGTGPSGAFPLPLSVPRLIASGLRMGVVRKTLLTYWNTVSFLSLYARASNFNPLLMENIIDISKRPIMDRWIISELNQLIESVDGALSNFDSQTAGETIAKFIDDLSNWYVRRSRRRFWDGDVAALSTLHECLEKLTLLMAPLVPFITEHVWQELIRPVTPNVVASVHLADFPIAKLDLIDKKLSDSVALTRRLVELGRASRAESKVKIRQPLSRALISASGWIALDQQLKEQISDELNVLKLDDISSTGSELVDISIKANFKSLGLTFGADVQPISKKIAELNPNELTSEIRNSGKAIIEYGAGKVAEIMETDLVITETPREGWSVASHSGESVALDLALTPELIAAGQVREVIRAVQDERKNAGFDISDRIAMYWNANDSVSQAIKNGYELISQEVLATSIERDIALKLGENELGLSLKLVKN